MDMVRLRVGSANVGMMSGRCVEVAAMAARRKLDFCCLQETRWRGDGVTMLEGREGAKFKFLAPQPLPHHHRAFP